MYQRRRRRLLHLLWNLQGCQLLYKRVLELWLRWGRSLLAGRKGGNVAGRVSVVWQKRRELRGRRVLLRGAEGMRLKSRVYWM